MVAAILLFVPLACVSAPLVNAGFVVAPFVWDGFVDVPLLATA